MKSLICLLLMMATAQTVMANNVPELDIIKSATIRGTGDCDRNGAFVPLHLGDRTHDLLLAAPSCGQLILTSAAWGNNYMTFFRKANGQNLADLTKSESLRIIAIGEGKMDMALIPVEGDTYVMLINNGVAQGLVAFKIIKVTETSVDIDYVVRNYSYGFDGRQHSYPK